jgi:hypothetical protein
MPLTTFHLLGLAIVAVLGVWVADRWAYRTHVSRMRRIARELKVRYSPIDRFNLASRIGGQLPDVAAADVRVRDLMYRTTDASHDYVFTVTYSVGTASGVRRRRLVAAAAEPHGRSCDRFANVRLADASCCNVAEQYATLLTPP